MNTLVTIVISSINMIFKKLKEYREQANRERFILPKEKDIEYFKDTIRECIKFIN